MTVRFGVMMVSYLGNETLTDVWVFDRQEPKSFSTQDEALHLAAKMRRMNPNGHYVAKELPDEFS